MNYEKAFKTLDNLYISLLSEYQNTVNEYSLEFKQPSIDEIDEIYENLVNNVRISNK